MSKFLDMAKKANDELKKRIAKSRNDKKKALKENKIVRK